MVLNYKARWIKTLTAGGLTGILTTVLTRAALASSGSGMPWETPLQSILDSITGPVARALGIICIIIAGFGWAFGEGNLKKILQIVFGISIAFTAATWGLTFFGFAGGVAF
jgi:type IV secretory pathway VirB2 component (pilin)